MLKMMDNTKNPNRPDAMSEHEQHNEGGREFGHVHQPTQAQQASKNQGLADDTQDRRNAEDALRRAREGEKKTA